MQTITAIASPEHQMQEKTSGTGTGTTHIPRNAALGGLERKLTWWAIKIRILYFLPA
jgi:hypothetical protein